MARKPLRQRVLAGETVLGSMIFELIAPGIPQLLVLAGAEYVIYDMEHTGRRSRRSRRRSPAAAACRSRRWCGCRAASTTSSPARSTSAAMA